jgi:hypothetical protein
MSFGYFAMGSGKGKGPELGWRSLASAQDMITSMDNRGAARMYKSRDRVVVANGQSTARSLGWVVNTSLFSPTSVQHLPLPHLLIPRLLNLPHKITSLMPTLALFPLSSITNADGLAFELNSSTLDDAELL